MNDKITGKVGFDFDKEEKKVDNGDFISKEETMWKVDGEGKAIPEKFPVSIYDRDLDRELMEESLMLMGFIKRLKANERAVGEALTKHNIEVEELKKKFNEAKTDEDKNRLRSKLEMLERMLSIEDIKSKENKYIVDDEIKESREIIKKLKEEIKKQTVEKYVMISPCTTSEAFLSFEKGKTIEGKETDDWVADLISKKCSSPEYNLEEAKKLRPDYKIALKQAIMTVSDYSEKSYRDIMIEERLAESKPLTLKKEEPIG